jgi:hypothetical protein
MLCAAHSAKPAGKETELDFVLELFGQHVETFNARKKMLLMASISATLQLGYKLTNKIVMNLENWINTRGTLSINSVSPVASIGTDGDRASPGLFVSLKVVGKSPEIVQEVHHNINRGDPFMSDISSMMSAINNGVDFGMHERFNLKVDWMLNRKEETHAATMAARALVFTLSAHFEHESTAALTTNQNIFCEAVETAAGFPKNSITPMKVRPPALTAKWLPTHTAHSHCPLSARCARCAHCSLLTAHPARCPPP